LSSNGGSASSAAKSREKRSTARKTTTKLDQDKSAEHKIKLSQSSAFTSPASPLSSSSFADNEDEDLLDEGDRNQNLHDNSMLSYNLDDDDENDELENEDEEEEEEDDDQENHMQHDFDDDNEEQDYAENEEN